MYRDLGRGNCLIGFTTPAEGRGCLLIKAALSPPPKRGRPKLSSVLMRYPPVIQHNEEIDEVAQTRNMQLLKKELERESPRKDIVLPLMKQLFQSRREYIVSDAPGVTASSILDMYPALSLISVEADYCGY